MVIQNDRVNSRHSSGIDSPRIVQKTPTQPISEFSAPNMGDEMSSKMTPTQPISEFLAPNMGDKIGSKKTPINEFLAPNMGDKMDLKFAQNGTNNTKAGNNNGISSRYLANFNIFLKRKNDVEVPC